MSIPFLLPHPFLPYPLSPPSPPHPLPGPIKRPPPPNPGDVRPPPPPPRSRKGSNFNLQLFGARFNKSLATKTCLIVGTMDGGLGVLVPLEEKMYKRLMLLQQLMGMALPTPLALNPRDYRTFKSSRFRSTRKKTLLDGRLLWHFYQLDLSLQEALAAAVGTSAYLVKENLREIDCISNFF